MVVSPSFIYLTRVQFLFAKLVFYADSGEDCNNIGKPLLCHKFNTFSSPVRVVSGLIVIEGALSSKKVGEDSFRFSPFHHFEIKGERKREKRKET